MRQLFASFWLPFVSASLSVEIITLFPIRPTSYASLLYNIGPIESGVADLRATYADRINFTHTIVNYANDTASFDDLTDQSDAVLSEWYYRARAPATDICVYLSPGKAQITVAEGSMIFVEIAK